MTLHIFKPGAAIAALDDWGTPEDIGATTLEGPIACTGKFLLGAPDKAVFGGLYAATRGRYRVVYGFHEHATVLEGELAITNEASGETTIYGPGDSWLIETGTAVIWEIRSERVVKSWIASTAAL
jgi:uncharacterized cupin superfamily protein